MLAHNIGQQYHFGAAGALGLGGIADSFYITLVQMLETGQHGAARTSIQVCLDFYNRWHGMPHLAIELQANSTGVRRHPVQDKTRRGNDAITAFFLDPRQAGEKLVCNVLAEPFLAEFCSGYLDYARLAL